MAGFAENDGAADSLGDAIIAAAVTELLSAKASGFAQEGVAARAGIDRDPAAAAVAALTGTQLVSEALSGREDVVERVEDLWRLLLPGLVPARVRNRLTVGATPSVTD